MIDVGILLGHLGILATREQASRRWVARCPNPDHQDSDPSWSIIDRPGDRKHGSHYCFACKFRGGPWELGAAVWGISAEEAGKRIRALFKTGAVPKDVPGVRIKMPGRSRGLELPKGVVIPAPGEKWFEPALDYLRGRGIPRWQIDRWGLGYALWGRLRRRVVVPVYTEGALRTFTARAIGPNPKRYDQAKVREGAQPKRALWGEPRFDRALGTVTVAEGVFSAMALERAGAPNPCAILGSELTPDRARILSGFRSVIIATDPDAAGDRVAKAIAILGRRARVERLRLDQSPDDADPDQLIEAVRKAVDNVTTE